MAEAANVTTDFTIDARFNGPPTSANGGYISGRLAQYVDAPAVRVRLRQPPPLQTPMTVRRSPDGGVHLLRSEQLVAEAAPAGVPQQHLDPVPPAVAEQVSAGAGIPQPPASHLFCVRAGASTGDGCARWAARYPEADTVASVDAARRSRRVATGGLRSTVREAVAITGRPMLLGQMTAAVRGPPSRQLFRTPARSAKHSLPAPYDAQEPSWRRSGVDSIHSSETTIPFLTLMRI